MFNWFYNQVIPQAVAEYRILGDRDVVEKAAEKTQLERVRNDLDIICEMTRDNPKARLQCSNTKAWLSETDDFKRAMNKRRIP